MSQAYPTLQALRAEDVMTRHPVTLDVTSTVQDAADLMVADVRHNLCVGSQGMVCPSPASLAHNVRLLRW